MQAKRMDKYITIPDFVSSVQARHTRSEFGAANDGRGNLPGCRRGAYLPPSQGVWGSAVHPHRGLGLSPRSKRVGKLRKLHKKAAFKKPLKMGPNGNDIIISHIV